MGSPQRHILTDLILHQKHHQPKRLNPHLRHSIHHRYTAATVLDARTRKARQCLIKGPIMCVADSQSG